ncbi:MAG: 50S ribosomal protein L9 [Rhodomicrobium sp.]
MQVILLERIGRLGQMGDIVKVRPGFARNFLLPLGKALRATKENMQHFEKERAQLEANNLQRKQEAEAVATKLNGLRFTVIRQAGDTGQLYGSVSTRDISDAVTAGGFTIDRVQVLLDKPIKNLGFHEVRVSLHPEVEVKVAVNVARTEEEAERQAAGEDVTKVKDDYASEYAAEQAAIAAEALFEGEAGQHEDEE